MFQIITIALTVLVAWITLYDREERSIYLSKKAVWILVPFIAFLLSFCIVKVPSNNVGIRWSILSGTSEKTLNDLGDKISAEEKSKVETEIDNTKKALETNDTEKIKEATEKLTKVFYDMSEQLYKNANPNGAQGVDPNAASGAGTNNGSDANNGGDNGNVYDADYKVEDDEK